MQIMRVQTEKRVFVANDGMQFPTAVECRRHESTQTFLKCKIDSISCMGNTKYIVKCTTKDELRDVLEFFDYTYSTDGFSMDFEEEEVQELIPGYIVCEYRGDEIYDECCIYSLDTLISEVDNHIKSLNSIKQTLQSMEV